MRNIHTRSRFTLAMIAFAAAGILALPVTVQGQWCDDFNDGDDDGWMHWTIPVDNFGTSWDVDPDPDDPNGFVYRLSVDGSAPPEGVVGSLLNTTDDPNNSTGYWWATTVREIEDTSVGLIMRGDLEDLNGYYFASGLHHLVIQRIDAGIATDLAYDPNIVQEVGTEYMLESGAIGSRLELRTWPVGEPRPESPQVVAKDCTYPSGVNAVVAQAYWGGDLSATFDDVCFAPSRPGDLDGDRDVDLADLARLLAAYDTCEGDPLYDGLADLDCSGCVDLTDLATLLADYGYSP